MKTSKPIFGQGSDWIESYIDEVSSRVEENGGRPLSQKERKDLWRGTRHSLFTRLNDQLYRELFWRLRWVTYCRYNKMKRQVSVEDREAVGKQGEPDPEPLIAISQFFQKNLKDYDKAVEEELSEIAEEIYHLMVTAISPE